MGIGMGIFLVALGAILYFAVSVDAEGFSINTIGLILMIVGAIGLVVSLLMGSMWSGRRERVREREVL